MLQNTSCELPNQYYHFCFVIIHFVLINLNKVFSHSFFLQEFKYMSVNGYIVPKIAFPFGILFLRGNG